MTVLFSFFSLQRGRTGNMGKPGQVMISLLKILLTAKTDFFCPIVFMKNEQPVLQNVHLTA